MNGTAIGVAAALLAGGGALYGGYQLLDGRGDDAARVAASSASDTPGTSDVPGSPGARSAAGEQAERLARRSGRGVPDGTTALDFDGGAAGDDLTDAARARAEEAEREAERLAMLGTGDLDVDRMSGDAVDTADAAAALRDRVGRADRPRGLRDSSADRADDADAAFERPRGDTDVDRLLADIAARSGEADDADRTGTDRPGSDGPSTDRTGTDGPAPRRLTANAAQTDKPDRGGFTANRRLTDKPDQGGYVASADTRRFDPCEKSDGTTYAGPGTALNPFADTDPCLPQATGQGYQVAQLAAPPDPAPPLVDVEPAAAALTPVNVARPRVPPPPAVGTGSDYRG